MPHATRTVLLLLLALAACPAHGSAGAEPAPPAAAGELAWNGTQLTLDGREVTPGPGGVPPVPYIRAAGGAPLVTALLDQLEPATFVLRPDPQRPGALLTDPYRSFLPQALPGGSVALVSVPDPLTGVSSAHVVLAADGSPRWRNAPGDQAQLLLPALDPPAEEAAASSLSLLRWKGGDALSPYGEQPELVHVNLADGTEAVLPLALSAAAAGVEVLAASAEAELLLVQYSFENYEFIAVSRVPLAITGRWPLTGQPLTRSVYPGPGYEYIGLSQAGERAALVVFEGSVQGVLETWSFDMLAGSQTQAAYLDELPLAADAANVADAAPGAVPYPQSILPGAGAAWTLQPWRDAAGRALVVFSDGAVDWIAAPAPGP
jgi:hypothetical protein